MPGFQAYRTPVIFQPFFNEHKKGFQKMFPGQLFYLAMIGVEDTCRMGKSIEAYFENLY